MILITGASGNLGSAVVEQLKKRLSTHEFIVTSSSELGVSRLKKQGLNARRADFNDPSTLHDAFEGVTELLLISTMEVNRLEQHVHVIDTAIQKNVKRIIYTSLSIKNIDLSGVKDLMYSHFQTEDYLIKSGLDYTILRNTMYADALPQLLGPNGLIQDIRIPAGKGKVPFALRREMGEGIANLLLENGHKNVIYDINGSYLLSFNEIANEIGKISNLPIQYDDIKREEFIKLLEDNNMPPFAVYLHSGTLDDIKNQQYEIKSLQLEQLLGRKSAGPSEFLREVFNRL